MDFDRGVAMWSFIFPSGARKRALAAMHPLLTAGYSGRAATGQVDTKSASEVS